MRGIHGCRARRTLRHWMSMRSILLATDRSPSASRRLRVRHRARRADRCVPARRRGRRDAWARCAALRSGARQEAHAASLHAVDEARRRNVPAGAIESTGDIVIGVLGAAESANADVIVVGSRGHGAVAAGVLGSVSNALLSRSTRPVMVVAAGAPTRTRSSRPYRRGSTRSSSPSTARTRPLRRSNSPSRWRPTSVPTCTWSLFTSLPRQDAAPRFRSTTWNGSTGRCASRSARP